MRSKGLPRLQKRLESREDPRPPVGILKICGIVVGTLVVRDHDLYRLSLLGQRYLHPGHYGPVAHAEFVLEQRRRVHADNLTRHVTRRPAVLTWPRPGHRSAWLEVHLEVRAHEDR